MNDVQLHQYHQHLQSNNTYLGRHDDSLPGPGFFFYNDSMHHWSHPIQPGQEKPRTIVLHMVGRVSGQGNFISLPGCVASLLGSPSASEKIRLKSLRRTALLGGARAGPFPQDWVPAMTKLKELTKLLTKSDVEPTRYLWFNEGGQQNDLHVKFGVPCFRVRTSSFTNSSLLEFTFLQPRSYAEPIDGRLADLIPAQFKTNTRWIEAAPTICMADINVIDHTGAAVPENLLASTLGGATVDVAFTLRGWKFGRDATWGFALDVKQIVVLRPEQTEIASPFPLYNPITPPRSNTAYYPPTPMTPSNTAGSSITRTMNRSSNGYPVVQSPVPNYMGPYANFGNGGGVGSTGNAVHHSDQAHMHGAGSNVPSIDTGVAPYINNANIINGATNIRNGFDNAPYPFLNTINQRTEFNPGASSNGITSDAENLTSGYMAQYMCPSHVQGQTPSSSMVANTAEPLNPLLLSSRVQLRSPFHGSANVNNTALQQQLITHHAEFMTDVNPPSPRCSQPPIPPNEEQRSNIVMPNFEWEDDSIAKSPLVISKQTRTFPDMRTTSAANTTVNRTSPDHSSTIGRPAASHAQVASVPNTSDSYPNNSGPASARPLSAYHTTGDHRTGTHTPTNDGDAGYAKGKKRAAPDESGDNPIPTKSAKTDSSHQVRGGKGN
ncbi:hypothetical protein F5876DRAFT_80988 [Lentinula aff. lateritia]|uniref:Uncharacterized protein n=1 Tax=Lentinula aff. lateritia TaxID=2804960 RepID=A0ACC1TN62_9AGAR|nr:hypothetical protein F5876DRAFT_80988 [Lentinula aff. lateritia]